MPDTTHRYGPATSAGRSHRRLSKLQPREHTSRVGLAWSRRTDTGYNNFKCPICGEPVRYLRIRGSLEPQIECSNPKCRWTVDELTSEPQISELAQKPKSVSTRQWFQSKGVA